MYLFISFFIGAVWLIWFIYTNSQPSSGVIKGSLRQDIKIEVDEGYDYLSFNITGTSFRRGLSKYVGEFDGSLVAESSNPYDSNAIKVLAADGHHIGYIPKDETEDVRKFLSLPCDCHGILQKEKDDDGHVYYWGQVVIIRKRS